MNGQNFLMSLQDKAKKYGFFQNIYLEAPTPEEAELLAVKQIRNTAELKNATLNAKDDPPMIYLNEITELESFEGIENLGEGRTFYPEKKWWQIWK